ncbi:maleylacetoacetate isomerase [Ahrensia sp. 13_GOM-1096m]|uniref:maleylacetoacetate isomerase n=1 Tax=Ahrensia sp. 13_GOM-1096m TaxID=1380380 RepID=UPI00047ED22E|nr:maleylacetoacetate isomerase [Ahrensia sp. 13_GOM-1096m]
MSVVLYDYWRSSASYRVRIALNMAGIAYESVNVDLLKKDHKSPEHLARHPQGLVPVLEIDGQSFTQSLAILDYLNETRNLELLPKEPAQRAKALALAHAIAVDIHPVCNLSVVGYATKGEEPARSDWMKRFIEPGLAAFEVQLGAFEQAAYCTGSAVGLADICLMPQLYNAQRWGADYSNCPRIIDIAARLGEIPAFQAAHPDQCKPA